MWIPKQYNNRETYRLIIQISRLLSTENIKKSMIKMPGIKNQDEVPLGPGLPGNFDKFDPDKLLKFRFEMVPMGRLELPRLTPLPPQDSVSTNSTTSAK